ncbi:myoneurin-like isoform X8 [Anopheles darlingi]|uniref:myoneurin-like isoform X8 n=1 Tax=Anopheles darlingi TaxID=43151 RepID=UPI002100199D|nr:myoneurin-like isoform X8 [Anopheles darlingi]
MLAKYCRVCLTSIGVDNQLEEVVYKSLSLYAMLCKMYPEAFIEYDDPQWPTRVCGNCKHGILDAFRLYTICMASFEVFKKQLPKRSIKTDPLSAEINLPVNSNLSGDDGVAFKEAVIIIDDEENEKHFLSSNQQEGLKTKKVKTLLKEHENLGTLVLHKEQADPLVAQNTKKRKIVSETVTSYENEVVELQLEMDYVPQPNTVSAPKDHLDDFEGSMEDFGGEEDSLPSSVYQENIDNDEQSLADPDVSDTRIAMNSRCWKNGSDESEDEDLFAEMFASEIFSCKSCRDVFLDKESYGKHVELHSKGYKKFCKMCNEGFKTVTALCAHECYSNSSILCWICGKIMDASGKHENHMKSHMPEEMWACPLCPVRFSSESVFKGHLLTHKKQKLFCCDVCGMNLSTKRSLRYHLRAIHGGGLEKVYSCNLCDQKFALPSYLKMHMNTHTGLRPYSCVYCNRVYGSGGDLVEHVAKHHVGNDNVYQCHLCDADFSKVRDLRAHYEVHYRNGDQFYNEILTDFGKFRFTTMDLLKMRHRKETLKSANIVLSKP